MPQHPLAEVFGYPIDNLSFEANQHRQQKLCPFGNIVATCTKDNVLNPLGVCSIFEGDKPVITCPIRFRQNILFAQQIAECFFPQNARWALLPEIRLIDKHKKRVGNIDYCLVHYDEFGTIIDFVTIEIQSVYISGNISKPFEHYMQDYLHRSTFIWSGQTFYPRPDYLSSSFKRLVPQIVAKGAIIKQWQKKQAIVLQKSLFETLGKLPEVDQLQADMVWFIYDLVLNELNTYSLELYTIIYTDYIAVINQLTIYEAGDLDEFLLQLQQKLVIRGK
ncbi:NotI family restriction endonuclease [Herpetosiphon llansteffanensis]|uniref:NotI family restriction endonuclease n=1 Tax=Herpetosiphon llansteffanensis TaxID=2094568 RepID=UPI000D7C8367|nr:NotI family restriction endonuclease [Herpetosiphon llansteffanensis]